PGAGYFHFPMERDREYFLQLTAEKQVLRFAKGVSKREWIKTRSRNEVLDCTVYALAAFKLLNADLAALSVGLETAPRAEQETTTQEQQNTNNQAWIPRMDNWLSR
ncbi:MAG: phage terminase large subunit family protein, partial [Proteobacteria bacterium]|nr:phage terminase large subunit family protein [Pseudomonadota bacterium]